MLVKLKRAGMAAGVLLALVLLGVWGYRNLYTPPEWRRLQAWAATARPGELLRGNGQLDELDGRVLAPWRSQQAAIPFLFSDSPEYLYNDAINKGLACMGLPVTPAARTHPEQPVPFGVGVYHINKTTDATTAKPQPQRLQVVVRLLRRTGDGTNTRPAIVTLRKGAYGQSIGMPVFAGKACVQRWFSAPNVAPCRITLQPGDARPIFAITLPPETGISAMFDLDATNGAFLKVYTVFGTVTDYDRIAFAPCGLTIGTNAGTGSYWKRTLRPPPGTPAFDAADTRFVNKTHLRFTKIPKEREWQDLVDEAWELRPENFNKDFVRRKGGKVRQFKGDYNVEYTVTIPVRSSSGKSCWFAVVGQQRAGIFGGAARTDHYGTVPIPEGGRTLLKRGPEGVLIDRVRVDSKTPVPYTFRWMLPGGSYGDHVFTLVPLGEQVGGDR